MKKAMLLAGIMFSCLYVFGRNEQLPRVIVKFKRQSDYKIDYNRNRIAVSSESAARVFKANNLIRISSLVRQAQASHIKSLDLISQIHFLEFNTAGTVAEIIAELSRTGLFEYVEADMIGNGGGIKAVSPNDTYFNRQWSLHNNGSFSSQAVPGADVDMPGAWAITVGSEETVVCILDSGVKLDHPELSGRLWVNPLEIPDNNIDDDKNGYVDDINGWDWVNNDPDPKDDHGHGTNVTGIIAANGNNKQGYAGVNWKCKVMIGKILDNKNSGFYSWWAAGIFYAVANGAKVISMSVGGSGFSQAMKDACDFAYQNNVTILSCMMNTNENVTYYPAGYESVIAIGATTVNDHRANPFAWGGGSNYGAHIDLVAPGNSIFGLSYDSNINYNSAWSGTSQATPLVAGIVSLLYGLQPSISPGEVKAVLQNTAADQVGDPSEDIKGFDQYMGYGRVNARLALEEITVYVFTGNGNWSDAANWKNKIIPPSQLQGGFEIRIDPTPGGECILNVEQTIAAGAKLTVQPGKNLRVASGLLIRQ